MWLRRAKIGTQIALWYSVSALYNIYNKRALLVLHLPWTIALVQLGGGLCFFLPLWLLRLRPAPCASLTELMTLLWSVRHVAMCATLAHSAGVAALGLGSVAFIQVVKAAEPLFTALLEALRGSQGNLSPRRLLPLLLVVAGVAVSSASELSLSWPCLTAGMLSNLFGGARSVLSKELMRGDAGGAPTHLQRLSPQNVYSVLTIASFLLLAPLAAFFEYSHLGSRPFPVKDALLSSLCFYVYNELSFSVLHALSPLSHSIVNVLKRGGIMLTSSLVFRIPLPSRALWGAALALGGAGLFSLCK